MRLRCTIVYGWFNLWTIIVLHVKYGIGEEVNEPVGDDNEEVGIKDSLGSLQGDFLWGALIISSVLAGLLVYLCSKRFLCFGGMKPRGEMVRSASFVKKLNNEVKQQGGELQYIPRTSKAQSDVGGGISLLRSNSSTTSRSSNSTTTTRSNSANAISRGRTSISVQRSTRVQQQAFEEKAVQPDAVSNTNSWTQNLVSSPRTISIKPATPQLSLPKPPSPKPPSPQGTPPILQPTQPLQPLQPQQVRSASNLRESDARSTSNQNQIHIYSEPLHNSVVQLSQHKPPTSNPVLTLPPIPTPKHIPMMQLQVSSTSGSVTHGDSSSTDDVIATNGKSVETLIGTTSKRTSKRPLGKKHRQHHAKPSDRTNDGHSWERQPTHEAKSPLKISHTKKKTVRRRGKLHLGVAKESDAAW